MSLSFSVSVYLLLSVCLSVSLLLSVFLSVSVYLFVCGSCFHAKKRHQHSLPSTLPSPTLTVVALELIEIVIEEFVVFSPPFVSLFVFWEEPAALSVVLLVINDGFTAGNGTAFATRLLAIAQTHLLLPVDRVLEIVEEKMR